MSAQNIYSGLATDGGTAFGTNKFVWVLTSPDNGSTWNAFLVAQHTWSRFYRKTADRS